MTRTKRIPDDTPVAELTVGQLRAELREAIEQYAPDSGGEADSTVSSVASDLDDLRREVDELGDYIERNIDFAYQVYEWWQAGMPDEGAAEIARLARDARLPRGPKPMTDRASVEAKQAELKTAGEAYGERAVAKALGVSRDAVRYALGKDH